MALTGGFQITIGAVRISSQEWQRPALVAAVSLVLYVARYRQHLRDDSRVLTHLRRPEVLAVLCAVAACAVGLWWGTFIGSGPDASGYVSQADMWRRGALTMPAPDWARDAPWTNAVWSSAPVGYRPRAATDTLVPVYSAGLPLAMAAFQRVAGSSAVFLVVPLFGAAAVWATFLLGRILAGGWAGVVAAALLLSSPTFLWFVIQPMSDVPAAACWAAALAFALRGRPRDRIAAGAATAAAVMLRPNLAPLGFIVALLLATGGSGGLRPMARFAFAAAPGPLAIGALNWYWHGSTIQSGYCTFGELYVIEHVRPNLHRYLAWVSQSQTSLFFAGLAAPLVLRSAPISRARAVLLMIGFPLAVLALYLPYLVFDLWQYARFLLPAFPVLLAGVGTVLVRSAARLRHAVTAAAAVSLVTAAVALHGWSFAAEEGFFEYARHEQRFARAVFFAAGLPRNAILVSNAYSGTLRFYSGRDVLRWEVVSREHLDDALGYLRGKGHPLYFVGDAFEVEEFKGRFPGTRTAGTLDGRLVTNSGGFVVYDLTLP